MFSRVQRRPTLEQLRKVCYVVFGLVLALAIWMQRGTITDSLSQLRSMSYWVIALLFILGTADRLIRVDIYRGLLDTPTYGTALTVHEVGAAASKGVPMGGALSTALRWSIARDAAIPTTTLTVALIASGVAATFVTWTLPLAAVGADLAQRGVQPTDFVVIGICAAVVLASVGFWAVVLGSDRIHRWSADRCTRLCRRAARRIPAAHEADATRGVDEVRSGLRAVAVRPWGLLGRTTVAQLCGAAVLFVALRGVGVGAELGTVEFLRVFFIVTLLGSFIPTPGGIGVIEAGLTGALVAAGVAPNAALAGVLVYRLVTYVMPIVIGTALYVVWRTKAVSRVAEALPMSFNATVPRANSSEPEAVAA
jgi:uncharacterized protein (TIRG00374 family)